MIKLDMKKQQPNNDSESKILDKVRRLKVFQKSKQTITQDPDKDVSIKNNDESLQGPVFNFKTEDRLLKIQRALRSEVEKRA